MTEEKKEETARFAHVLVLGVGGGVRNVRLDSDSEKPPRPFVEFIDGFRSGKRDLIWTPTPANPIFAIRMNSVDFYEYRVAKIEQAGGEKPAED